MVKHSAYGCFLAMACILSVQAKTFIVGSGWARPPYIVPASDSGFELELVQQVFRDLNHQTKIRYAPHIQTVEMLRNGLVDLALTLKRDINIEADKLSDVYVVYQNVGLSLKSKQLNITQLQDMKGLRVVGFQSASQVLGTEFSQLTNKNNLYTEVADQRRQLELLLEGQIDVIIIDINVFNFISRELTGKSQIENVNIHPLFALSRYSVGFNDLELKTEFNQALGKFVADGRYEKLKSRYDLQQIEPISAKQ